MTATLSARILRLLRMGPMDTRQLANTTGASLATVRNALFKLRRGRAVFGENRGNYGHLWRAARG